MTKEDVKNFLHENKDKIAYGAGLTVTCIFVYAVSRFMYKSGYDRGNYDTSINVKKTIGDEKYEQLRVAMIRMLEGNQT